MIKQFNKENLKMLCAELDAAAAIVAAKHGVTLKIGTVSFGGNDFSCKLSGVVKLLGATGEEVKTDPKWGAAFLNYCQFYGLKKTDLGRKFQYQGQMVTLVGARPKATKPLVVMTPNGKFAAVAKDAVKDLLEEVAA